MYHIAKGMLKSESDCEDVVSEAVLKAYTKIHTLKEEKYFKTWLIRILINECYKNHENIKGLFLIEDHRLHIGRKNLKEELEDE